MSNLYVWSSLLHKGQYDMNKAKYELNDQVFILLENRIRYVIINEIKIKRDSISYVLLYKNIEESERILEVELDERNLFSSIKDLTDFLVTEFNNSMNIDEEDSEIIHYSENEYE